MPAIVLTFPVKPRCPWTADEIGTLRRLAAAGYTDGEIAERLRRSRAEIQGKRHRLGITAGMSPGLKGMLLRLSVRRLQKP